MDSPQRQISRQKSATSRRVIAAGAVGNVIEWYDFALYGYLAITISELFFPHDIKAIGLIATFGTFAVGFLMRPIGAVLFGHLGDTLGRKFVLVVSVIAMAVPTALIGTLPTYQSIGIWAPVLLVFLRILQGLSVGGEFSGSVTYLVEIAPQNRRGFVASWSNVGGSIGLLLGAGTPALMIYVIGGDSFSDWGWRLPFMLGGVIGVVALIMRRLVPDVEDNGEGGHAGELKETPLKSAFKAEFNVILKVGIYCLGYGMMFYVLMVFFPTWVALHTSMELHQALLIITLVIFLQVILVPVAAFVSDTKITRKNMIVVNYVISAVVVVPLYLVAHRGGFLDVTGVSIIFSLLLVIPLAVSPAMLAEVFDRKHRLTAYSISFNTGMAVGGGTSPMIAMALIHYTGNIYAPAYMLVFGCLMSAGAILLVRDRSREQLR